MEAPRAIGFYVNSCVEPPRAIGFYVNLRMEAPRAIGFYVNLRMEAPRAIEAAPSGWGPPHDGLKKLRNESLATTFPRLPGDLTFLRFWEGAA